MKKKIAVVVCGLFALGLHIGVFAAEKGSADEAVAMVKKAIAYMKVNGKEKALAEFSNPAGHFRDRDLYIFATDMSGNVLANGINAKLIGKNLMEVKDADGKFFVKAYIEIANSKGKGWVDYKWPNPSTITIEAKSTYVEKNDELVIGCGFYK